MCNIYIECFEGNRSVLMQNKVDVNSSCFRRPWSDYKNGFSDSSGNFWLGNDVISGMTSSYSCELYILMHMTNGAIEYVTYNPITVRDESHEYELSTITKSGGNVSQDGLASRQGQKFSTYDYDNDADSSTNCANYIGCGFWFGTETLGGVACGFTNLNANLGYFQWYESSVSKTLSRSQMWLTC